MDLGFITFFILFLLCSHEKRFLVNYSQQLVLVEPDSKQIGWGIITFIGSLQVSFTPLYDHFSDCIALSRSFRQWIQATPCFVCHNGYSNESVSVILPNQAHLVYTNPVYIYVSQTITKPGFTNVCIHYK